MLGKLVGRLSVRIQLHGRRRRGKKSGPRSSVFERPAGTTGPIQPSAGTALEQKKFKRKRIKIISKLTKIVFMEMAADQSC